MTSIELYSTQHQINCRGEITMKKNYISILELIPELILQAKREYSWSGPFNSTSGERHFFNVEETDEEIVTLVFKHFRTELRLALDADPQHNDNVYVDGQTSDTPYIFLQPYEVPDIIEIEYLRASVYGELLTEDQFQYLRELMYHYVVAYHRIMDPRETRDIDLDTNLDQTSHLYTTLMDKIHEIDPATDDGQSSIKTIVENTYDALQTSKAMSESDRNAIRPIAIVEKTFDGVMKHIAKLNDTYPGIWRTLELSRATPILALYSLLDKSKGLAMDYSELKQIRAQFNNSEIYDAELLSPEQMAADLQRRIASYVIRSNGCAAARYGRDYDAIEELYNIQIFPHIFNIHRKVNAGDTLAISIDELAGYVNEAWTDQVTPLLTLNAGRLDWSKNNE